MLIWNGWFTQVSESFTVGPFFHVVSLYSEEGTAVYGVDTLRKRGRLFKYIENFTTKNENFQMKNSGSFHISAQNIDCGYLLEPPRRGGSNEYPQSIF